MTALEQVEVDLREPEVFIRPMLTINHAIDLFAGDLSRRGCSDRTRDTYTRILGKLADRIPADLDVTRITSDDCRRFLDLYNRRAAGTRAHAYAVLSSFFRWLIVTEQIKRSPMTTIPRPQRKQPDELDVTTISADDVRRLLAAAQTWTEKLAVAIPVYIGPRRRAIARLRLRDYDRDRRRLRFFEKGGKVIWKPVPDELANLIGAAIADGAIAEPDDYLVPPEGHLNLAGDRDDRVVWRVVKRVGDRAGVDVHVHALRAAFAVFYLEANPGDTHGLQILLGHRNPATTQIYLRKLNTETSMERVRGLSWAPDSDPMIGGSDDPLSETQATDARAGARGDSGAHAGARMACGRSDGRADRGGLPEVLGSCPVGEPDDGPSDRRTREVVRSDASLSEARLAAGVAANDVSSSSVVVGAGGFEPPNPEPPLPERAGSEHLLLDLLDEVRLAAERRAVEPEAVSPDGAAEAS